jgi:hypothetical protein
MMCCCYPTSLYCVAARTRDHALAMSCPLDIAATLVRTAWPESHPAPTFDACDWLDVRTRSVRREQLHTVAHEQFEILTGRRAPPDSIFVVR